MRQALFLIFNSLNMAAEFSKNLLFLRLVKRQVTFIQKIRATKLGRLVVVQKGKSLYITLSYRGLAIVSQQHWLIKQALPRYFKGRITRRPIKLALKSLREIVSIIPLYRSALRLDQQEQIQLSLFQLCRAQALTIYY